MFRCHMSIVTVQDSLTSQIILYCPQQLFFPDFLHFLFPPFQQSSTFILVYFPISSSLPSPCFHVHISFALRHSSFALPSPYCIIPSSTSSVLALSLGHLISLPLPLWFPRHKAWSSFFCPFISLLPHLAFLSPCCPISNPSLCLSLCLSLSLAPPVLLPQPEVNTLQDGIISSPALRQYKNSEWTAQSLFHLRFDCNGIASCPWEAPAASPTQPLWH